MYQRYFWGGGEDFVGFHQPQKFSFLLHFWATILSVWGFIKRKFFEKIWLNETPHSQKHFFGQILAKFFPFLPKMAIFDSNPLFFQNFGAFGAEIWFFPAAFGGRSVKLAPSLLAHTSPKISLKCIQYSERQKMINRHRKVIVLKNTVVELHLMAWYLRHPKQVRKRLIHPHQTHPTTKELKWTWRRMVLTEY